MQLRLKLNLEKSSIVIVRFTGYTFYINSYVQLVRKMLSYWNLSVEIDAFTGKVSEFVKIWSLQEFITYFAIKSAEMNLLFCNHKQFSEPKQEIERKFKLDQKSPILKLLEEYPNIYIKQGYFCTERDLRVRTFIINGKNILPCCCIKSEDLTCRIETKIPLSQRQFEEFWKYTENQRIEKTRYLIPYKHYIIEIDIYHKNLEGLIIAEVEFETIKDSKEFKPPTWLGQDVTTDVKYKNKNLSIANFRKDIR